MKSRALSQDTERTKFMEMACNICPGCDSQNITAFYQVERVVVHSVLLMPTRNEALSYPKSDIQLAFCQDCGFIFNLTFNPTFLEYSSRYEETQGYSPTFNLFHQRLADRLIKRYDLYDKDIIEIGCGKGEFLTLLCQMGDNRGYGFDPAYVEGRTGAEAYGRTTFIKDYYSEKYAGYHGDFICCKMTLEHIPKTYEFVNMIRNSIADHLDTIVFFQVPNATYVLRDVAFWDIYYEHCSYFTFGSLARLFRKSGFEVIDLSTDYNEQYIMIEARPNNGKVNPIQSKEDDLVEVRQAVSHFSKNYNHKFEAWKHELQQIKQAGKRAVIWGAGSKGVAFLTTLNLQDEIGYCVDINPHKYGTFLPGSGHEIVAPEFLQYYKPDVVIVMNPIYCDEIKADLNQMGLTSELISV